MQARFTHEARAEFNALPSTERPAMRQVIVLLETFDDRLGAPHSSQVRGARVRELRPRGGRSPWRAFYRRVGNEWLIGAFGSEAQVDPEGFDRSVRQAEERIAAEEARP